MFHPLKRRGIESHLVFMVTKVMNYENRYQKKLTGKNDSSYQFDRFKSDMILS